MNLALVLLDEPRMPQPDAVLEAYRAISPAGPALTADRPIDAHSAVFHFANGGSVIVGLMDAPVPNGEAALNAAYSLSAIGTGWTCPDHRAHLAAVWFAKHEWPVLDQAIAFTRVVAAIASAAGAVGIYTGGSQATHDPRFFIDVASSDEALPGMLMVWNGVSLAKSGDRLSILSLGMSQFDLPNLLLTAPAAHANDALAYHFDVLAYVMTRGERLPEGDTIGMSADERITIRYEPSPTGDGTEVWRVDL